MSPFKEVRIGPDFVDIETAEPDQTQRANVRIGCSMLWCVGWGVSRRDAQPNLERSLRSCSAIQAAGSSITGLASAQAVIRNPQKTPGDGASS